MSTEISRDSHSADRRYSGVYQQQGRMLTDADWNELVDILKQRLNDALVDVVGGVPGSGGGVPHHRQLKLLGDLGSVFKIDPGHVYVEGVHAEIQGESTLSYVEQTDFPSPPNPLGDYFLYLDVWERTVTWLMDDALRDIALHGADTCTRTQVLAQLKWCPDSTDPESSPLNPNNGDAALSLTLSRSLRDRDPCEPCVVEINDVNDVGNYLFRVEVHDVKGDANAPTEITLKWSSENGAESYAARLPGEAEVEPLPGDFVTDKWVYEFFDEVSDKHRGNHIATGWSPERGIIQEHDAYTVPNSISSLDETVYVRRWDGYCVIDLAGSSLTKGRDRNQALLAGLGETEHGHVSIGNKLKIVLNAIQLELQVDGSSFVPGDYWLADVREASYDPQQADTGRLLVEEPPRGVVHRYLKMGHVQAGVLQDNPEADRKFAFPSLSELTHIFIGGGDGQHAMPGLNLPNPLLAGVVNGEWPVSGAYVQFKVKAGNGELLKPDLVAPENYRQVSDDEAIVRSVDGLCACAWKLGNSGEQQVTGNLLDAEQQALPHPALTFDAQLSLAENVAYTPECPDPGASVHTLLGDDAFSGWPALDMQGYTTVDHALDTLLCKLSAGNLPYDADAESDCWKALAVADSEMPQTTQQAIDLIACRVGSVCCTIKAMPGDDIQQKISSIDDDQDLEICFESGLHELKQGIDIANKGNVVIRGCGAASRLNAMQSESVIRLNNCASVRIHDLFLESGQSGKDGALKHLNGTLDVVDVRSVSIENIETTCAVAAGKRSACCLRAANSLAAAPGSSVRVVHSRLVPGHKQIGILLVNVERAQVEDNEVRAAPKPDGWKLEEALKDKAFRNGFRNVLISNFSWERESSASDISRNGSFDYDGRNFRFSTDPALVPAWQKLVAGDPPKSGMRKYQLIKHMKKLADKVLLDPGTVDPPEFSEWYESVASVLPHFAAQGIAVVGESAKDIRILNNSLTGVARGVSVGISKAPDFGKKYSPISAGRVQIRGNTIQNTLTAEHQGVRHGIFVGNSQSVDIESNYLQVTYFPEEKSRTIEGIRFYGFMGKFLLVRQNHLIDYKKGIFGRIYNPHKSKLWQVVDNMLEGVSMPVETYPAGEYLEEHNERSS